MFILVIIVTMQGENWFSINCTLIQLKGGGMGFVNAISSARSNWLINLWKSKVVNESQGQCCSPHSSSDQCVINFSGSNTFKY